MLLTKNPLTRPGNVTTGVHGANDVTWLWEKESIDLIWDRQEEEAARDRALRDSFDDDDDGDGAEGYDGRNDVGDGSGAGEDVRNEEDGGSGDGEDGRDIFDDAGCCDYNSGPQLFGSWRKKNSKYSPSREEEFSAIYDPDFNTVQVVRSKYVIRCAICSPCFPNQGDVDSDGNLWAYCLPPDYMDEDWLLENKHRIFYRHKYLKGNSYWKKWNA